MSSCRSFEEGHPETPKLAVVVMVVAEFLAVIEDVDRIRGDPGDHRTRCSGGRGRVLNHDRGR